MYELDAAYLERLETLAGEVQASDELATYLEEEEEEQYQALRDAFEPQILGVYEEVAAQDPLQLIHLEQILLDPAFEGLFIPKILGYAVLRGEINDQYRYIRPQEHFRDVLLAVGQSDNFDILKKRIGQSIQIGFALSSDIWISNLIKEFENKRVRYFLQSQKLEKYRDRDERKAGYERYKLQFRQDNYMTAQFPESEDELAPLARPLVSFIIYRIKHDFDNSSILPPLQDFVDNEAFQGAQEHLEITGLYALYFDLGPERKEKLTRTFNQLREKVENFDERFLQFLLRIHHQERLRVTPEADLRMAEILDTSVDDDLSGYYTLVQTLHEKGYEDPEAQEAIKTFYMKHDGLSTVNEAVRQAVFQYFERAFSELDAESYTAFFELTKLFPLYMDIFANQQFNQDLKELSMAYVRRLLKRYTDKRGKDYQDIKKFVSTTFQDFNFLKEKEVVELFKTRRKKRKTSS